MSPPTCDWCGDELEETGYVKVVHDEDGALASAEILARFHTETCYGEARDYGWEQ